MQWYTRKTKPVCGNKRGRWGRYPHACPFDGGGMAMLPTSSWQVRHGSYTILQVDKCVTSLAYSIPSTTHFWKENRWNHFQKTLQNISRNPWFLSTSVSALTWNTETSQPKEGLYCEIILWTEGISCDLKKAISCWYALECSDKGIESDTARFFLYNAQVINVTLK